MNHKVFEKITSINCNKFLNIQRKPVNTLNYALMGQQICLPLIFLKPYNKLLTMKTTTKTGKNQKFSRKVPEEIVEAIQIINSSLKILSLI